MCTLWLAHHRATGDVVAWRPAIVTSTFVWLGAMVLLPLWSQVLWNGGDDRGVYAAYIATIMVAVGSAGVVRLELQRHPEAKATGVVIRLTERWLDSSSSV